MAWAHLYGCHSKKATTRWTSHGSHPARNSTRESASAAARRNECAKGLLMGRRIARCALSARFALVCLTNQRSNQAEPRSPTRRNHGLQRGGTTDSSDVGTDAA